MPKSLQSWEGTLENETEKTHLIIVPLLCSLEE